MLTKIKTIYNRFIPKAMVLMYHRVTTLPVDPWQLAVEPDVFDQQLSILKRFGTIVSPDAFVHNLERGKLKNRSFVITFDDGYYDNYSNAFPLLKKHNAPATFFISTNQLGRSTEFWWDELETVLIHSPVLPPEISMSLHGIEVHDQLENETVLTPFLKSSFQSWQAINGFESKRTKLYELLWQQLRPLKHSQQQEVLSFLRNWAGNQMHARIENRAMSEMELEEMSNDSLVAIGGHTVTHPDLASQEKSIQEEEIYSNKKRLEELTGVSPQLFAYPFGRFNDDTISIVENSGYKAAFTTNSNLVKRDANLFLINRIQVNNWKPEEFIHVLNNYFQTHFK